MLKISLLSITCTILLINIQLAVGSKNSRLFSFTGGPIDDLSSASTHARYLVIRTDLMGKIKFVVRQGLGMLDMKVKVKLTGMLGSNISSYAVKYRRKWKDPSTILLEVHESKVASSTKKWNRTSFIIVICVGSVCAFATLSAIFGCIIIVLCRRQRPTMLSNRNKKLKRRNDRQDKGGDGEASNSKHIKQNKHELYRNFDNSDQFKKSRQKQDGGRNEGNTGKGKTKSASTKNSSMMKRVCADDNARSYIVERKEEDKQTWGIYEGKENTTYHSFGNEEKRVNHGNSRYEIVIDEARDTLDKGMDGTDRDSLKKMPGRKKHPCTDSQTGEKVDPYYNDSNLSAISANKCYRRIPSISADSTLGSSLKEVEEGDIQSGSSVDSKSFQNMTRPVNRKHSLKKSRDSLKNMSGRKKHPRTDSQTGEKVDSCYNDSNSSLTKKTSPATTADYAKGWGYSYFDTKTNKAVVKSYPSDVESPNSFIHIVGYSNDNKSTSKTVNGSIYGLVTEDMRSAQIVRQKSSRGCVMELETKKSRNAKRTKLAQEDTTNVVKTSKNAKENKIGFGNEYKGKKARCRTANKNSSKGSSSLKFHGPTLLIMSILACLAAPITSQSSLGLLQTATADIEIEIPSDLFDSVLVITNKLHVNPIVMTGDNPVFILETFEVNSASAIVTDKCRGKDPRLCHTGICDPLTGNCVCPTRFKYHDLSRKCIPVSQALLYVLSSWCGNLELSSNGSCNNAEHYTNPGNCFNDCSISCPFETFAAVPCNKSAPAICKKCRSLCPKNQYESVACGGRLNRRCTDISRLPKVKTGKGIISENRMKTLGMQKRIHPKPHEKPVITVNRGTGIEVVINVLEAGFNVTIGEVLYKDYDKDPNDVRHSMCKHNLPLYYIARRSLSKQKFYYPSGRVAHCQNKRHNTQKSTVYCLNFNNELVRLFTKKVGSSDKRHHEKSANCKSLIQQCLDCTINCSRDSKQPKCSKTKVQCFESCKAKKCDCMKESCPCQMYVTERCDSKRKGCFGTSFSAVKLTPVFSWRYSYCHAKVLHLARYKIRTDLYVNKKLIMSKLHRTIAKPRSTAVVDDYGYMNITMPDSLKVDGKDFLLRGVKNTLSIEIGRLLTPTVKYNGHATDALAVIPNKPFSINQQFWKNATCDKIKTYTFRAVDRYPLTRRPPDIFKKIIGLKITKVPNNANRGKKDFSIFRISKPNMQQFLDIRMPKQKSVLRNIFSKSFIDPKRLKFKLLNKRSYWSIVVGGYLKSCPGSLTAKVYDQEQANKLLFFYDFAVTNQRKCRFTFEFNIPIKGSSIRTDKAYVLHLMSSSQVLKYVLIQERKVGRILPNIIIPAVNKQKLLNAVIPISAVSAGLIYLVVVIVIFGVVTQSRSGHIEEDSNFHFRHIFVVIWFVSARVAKSLLFTATFISYIFVVIHSENYHTLKTYSAFQKKEKIVFESIFKEMEKHRIAEIDRQNRRFIKEKSICELKLQRLDIYLANRKRDASWRQQLSKRYKSIKLAALANFEEKLGKARSTLEKRKRDVEAKIDDKMNQVKSLVDRIERKVMGNIVISFARALYKVYRFWGGSKSLTQYVGLQVHFGNSGYKNRIASFSSDFHSYLQVVKNAINRQGKSESLNFEAWKEQAKSRARILAPKLLSVLYRKNETTVKFDKDLLQSVLGITWVVNLVKNKIISKIGLVLMIIGDALLFVYRHTRTYAMAVLMIYGFKKIHDLDKAPGSKDKNGGKALSHLNEHGLDEGYNPGVFDDDSYKPIDASDKVRHMGDTDPSSQRLIGDELSSSVEEVKQTAEGIKQSVEDINQTKEETEQTGTGPGSKVANRASSDPLYETSYTSSGHNGVGAEAIVNRQTEQSVKDKMSGSKGTRAHDFPKNVAAQKKRSKKPNQPGMSKEVGSTSMTVIGWLGALLLWFINKMRIFGVVNIVLLNTHLVLVFFLLCIVIAGSYFTIVTAKYVLRTAVLDDLGFFDAKLQPILAYRKVVNTRAAVNAFMINHVHIPYYEARMNARIEIYRIKASLFKKLQCARAVLHNAEYCSWKKPGATCQGIKHYDDGFYKNLTQFKCHMNPALPRRYANFDKVQFKVELIRSYSPYIAAIRGLVLDTFQMILAIVGIHIAIKISAKLIFKVLFAFNMIRQIKVYQTNRPL